MHKVRFDKIESMLDLAKRKFKKIEFFQQGKAKCTAGKWLSSVNLTLQLGGFQIHDIADHV